MSLLVMADSRGVDLEKTILYFLHTEHGTQASNIGITFRIMSDAKLDNIVEKMDEQYQSGQFFDLIYVFAGVQDLIKMSPLGKVRPNFDNIPELIDTMANKISVVKQKLRNRASKVAMVQLVGLHLCTYNQVIDDGFWYYAQSVIDDAMPILAHTINYINRADRVVGPRLANTVHEVENNRQHNRYSKLGDGLHPTDRTKAKWAKLFADSIWKNYARSIDS